MNIPDDLKNVHVNLDSETARAIADQYITFRYVENFSIMLFLLLVFIGLPLYIYHRAIRAKIKYQKERDQAEREYQELRAKR